MTEDSVQLIRRWQKGDDDAARAIYERYVGRLISLAASRISPGLARRVEAEDVVQSVYRSFFTRIGDDRLQVVQSGQLWGLLAAITVNKVRAKARYHGADKRDFQTERSTSSNPQCFGLAPGELAREPTAEEATMLAEQYQQAADQLSPLGKEIFRLYLENEAPEEIARQVHRSMRTVRRELEQIRTLLTDALAKAASAGSENQTPPKG